MTNRRTFIGRLAAGIAGFTILPGAGRVWVAKREVIQVAYVANTIGVIPQLDPDPIDLFMDSQAAEMFMKEFFAYHKEHADKAVRDILEMTP